MKYMKTILFAVTVFTFLSFQQTDAIVGKWEMYKMESPDGEVREASGRWMEFLEGGELKGGNSLETVDRTGNWEYNERTSELTVTSEEQRDGEGTFKVTWIDDKTIYIVVTRGRKIYMRRI